MCACGAGCAGVGIVDERESDFGGFLKATDFREQGDIRCW